MCHLSMPTKWSVQVKFMSTHSNSRNGENGLVQIFQENQSAVWLSGIQAGDYLAVL